MLESSYINTVASVVDELFRQSNATEALQANRGATSSAASKPWMKHYGSLRHLGSKHGMIEACIVEEFEKLP